MRTFKHFNQSGNDVCPVCKTKDDKETTLIMISGTQEGNIAQAIQVHVDCIELTYAPERSEHEPALFIQVINFKNEKGNTKT